MQAFVPTASEPPPLPTSSNVSTEPTEQDTSGKSPFMHPKSAPVRNEEMDCKKQHFAFLGNLMAAPETREVVLARQKQYYDDLCQQVLEKRQTVAALDESPRLSPDVQLPDRDLHYGRLAPEQIQTNSRFRKKHEIENHVNLQVHGSCLCGGALQRDEVALIRKKKEEQQREMQEALRKQIEEKTAQKLAERLQQQQDFIASCLHTERPSESPPAPLQCIPTDSRTEIDLLNAKVEEMQKSNIQLREKIKEQHDMLEKIQEEKPRDRLKSSLRMTVPCDSPAIRTGVTPSKLTMSVVRKKESLRARQTAGIFRQSTYSIPTPPSPFVTPRLQSAFASGGVSPISKPGAVSAPKATSTRVFFGGNSEFSDPRQNLDTAGESHFLYPHADGLFYHSAKDELDKLIEKIAKSPSNPQMGQSGSGHHSQISSLPSVDSSAGKINRFPRDVFAPRKRL